MSLDKIKLAHSPLTDSIYLYRHGKSPGLALEKRDAEADVFTVLIEHMMFEAPRGATKTVHLGETEYEVRVTPKKGEHK